MNVELDQAVVNNVKRTLEKYFSAKTEDETRNSFEEAMLTLQQVNDCIEQEKQRYEDHIEDFIDSIHV